MRFRPLLALLVAIPLLLPSALPAGPSPQAPDALGMTLDAHAQDLRTAGALLQLRARSSGDGLRDAVDAAKAATLWQAETMGLDLSQASVPSFRHETPSEAAFALLARHGAVAEAGDEARLRALDGLPPGTAAALARLFDAFLAYDASTSAAFAGADLSRLQALRQEALDGLASAPVEPFREAGIDAGGILVARAHLLDATLVLRDALRADGLPRGSAAAAACSPIVVAPALALDVDGCSGTYTQEVALSLDIFGADTYLNNGGGSRLAPSCSLDTGLWGAAALVDLNAGQDVYDSPLPCAANGGGSLAAGLLVDDGGSDRYDGVAGTEIIGFALNGGGGTGIGMLLDAGGSDSYVAGYYASSANGGSYAGHGTLIDVSGDDSYVAEDRGTNGGGGTGSGFLYDADGADSYRAVGVDGSWVGGHNGGGVGGRGFLLDASGSDTYLARGYASNGGGRLGSGFLMDVSGNDAYTASAAFGAGALNGGTGQSILWDLVGSGLLMDLGGTDVYSDTEGGSGVDRSVLPKGVLGVQFDSTSLSTSQCLNGIDDDGDGFKDFPMDPACGGPFEDETPDPPVCLDGRDNDGDLLADYPADAGCGSLNDPDEGDDPECADGIDNDGDGRTDWPADVGCSRRDGPRESSDPECADGVDNDGDGQADWPDDKGCAHELDDFEGTPACGDLADNDGDGFVDTADPGCADETDPSESPNPQCSNGVDDDGDGRADHPADVGCLDARDDSESPTPQCSDGVNNDPQNDIWADFPADRSCSSPYDDDEST